MVAMHSLLHIGRRSEYGAELCRILEDNGYQVACADSSSSAAQADYGAFACILADGQALSGEQLLDRVIDQANLPPVIVVGGDEDVRQAVQAMKQGAADYLPLGCSADELLTAVRNASAAKPERMADLSQAPFAMAGSSDLMTELRRRIVEVGPTDASVLIQGESGTGKVFLAHAIHAASKRSLAPLITANCAAIPERLLEAELFGAPSSPGNGLLEAASGGTLFLEDVDDLPPVVQSRLALLLRGGDGRGGEGAAAKPPNLRVLSASHRNLQQLVVEGRFNEDLLRLLNDAVFILPPLRERRQDIIELAGDLLNHACRKLGKKPLRISGDALDSLSAYHWPSNVRELTNVMERAAILCDAEAVEANLLAIHSQPQPDSAPAGDESDQPSLEAYFVSFVLQHQEQLTETELAERLGISRKSLWERRQRLNMPRTKTKQRGPRRP